MENMKRKNLGWINKVKEKIYFTIIISRPIFWLIPVLFFIAAQTPSLLYRPSLPPLAIIQALLLLFPYNILLYSLNDLNDINSDKINKRKKDRDIEKHKKYLLSSSIIIIAILFVSSLLTRNLLNIGAMLLLLCATIFYSSPPLRLKTKPPLDTLTSSTIYYLSTYLLGWSFAHTIYELPIVKVLLATLAVAGAHALSTIVDYTPDKIAGDTTFAVKFGKRRAALFAFITLLVAALFGAFRSVCITFYLILLALMSLYLIFNTSEERALKLVKVAAFLFYVIAIYTVLF